MGTTKLIGELLLKGLSVWELKEKTRYTKEVKSLLEEYDKEMDKPHFEDSDLYPDLKARAFRDNSKLDRIDRRMRNLGQAIISAPKKG